MGLEDPETMKIHEGLPPLAYGVLLSDNSLIMIQRGRSGYFQLSHIYRKAYQPERMGLADMHAVADKLRRPPERKTCP